MTNWTTAFQYSGQNIKKKAETTRKERKIFLKNELDFVSFNVATKA
jgi:hypothetical protein